MTLPQQFLAMLDRHKQEWIDLQALHQPAIPFSAIAEHSSRQYQELAELAGDMALKVKSLQAFKNSVDEALNSGDGSYRP